MTKSAIHPGACLCGKVRFQFTGDPLVTMACHCTGCQRMTASAFSLSALVRARDFTVTDGEPVLGALRGATRHFFCPSCLSWLFTRPDDGFVNVRATLLDDPRWATPFMETYVCERLDWVRTPAAHSFERWPQAADYPRMIAAFAEQTARA